MKTTLKRKSLVSVATALALSGSLNGTTYTVTTLLDQNDANCTDTASLSLRDAIACATAAGDIVNFGVNGALDLNASNGSLIINNDISVSGPGMQNISFSPDAETTIFSVPVGSSVAISGMTINGVNTMTGNKAIDNLGDLTLSDCNISNNQSSSTGNAAGISNTGTLSISNSYIGNNTDYSGFSNGSALYNSGTLTIDASVIEGNTGASMGSALYSSSGTVTITNSTVSGNTGQYGGAVVNGSTSSMSISDSNISGNVANYNGGAINNSGTLSISTSTINDNNASNNGGAIYFSTGSVTIVNSTLSGNVATGYLSEGGAIYNYGGDLNINGTTVQGSKVYGYGGAISSSGTTTITNSILQNNSADGGDGGGVGGAISSLGDLSISASSIDGNSAYIAGGAIHVDVGSVTVIDSNISGNIAGSSGTYYSGYGNGGGIENAGSNLNISGTIFEKNQAYYGGGVDQALGTLTIVNSTFRENNASYGGGISATGGFVTISQSTFNDNNASFDGGGINLENWSQATFALKVNILNSTISGNTAGDWGGGMSLYDGNAPQNDVNISHSTITNNTAPYGGGIFNRDTTIQVKNTILAGNSATSGPDCVVSPNMTSVTMNSYGYNLVEDNSSCSGFSASYNDIIGTPPQLLTLADNGGPTWTHALDTLSPARLAGDPSGLDILGNSVLTDQRGLPRATPPAIGAYEPQSAEMSLDTTPYDFGTLYIGDTSSEYNISITNIGESSMTVDNIYMLGGTPEFGWNNYCGSVDPGASCAVGVYFYPGNAQTYTDSIVIASTGSGLSTQVALSGTGTTAPAPNIGTDTPSVDFGTITTGTTATTTLTVTNSGSATLNLGSVSLMYGYPEFTINNNCPSSLSAGGGSCTIDVSFTPSAVSTYGDVLQIISDDPDTPTWTVGLTGSGQSATSATSFTGTMTLPSAPSSLYLDVFIEETDSTGTASSNWYSSSLYYTGGATSASFDIPITNTSGYYKVGYMTYSGDVPAGYLNQAYVGTSGLVWSFSDAKVFTAAELQSGMTLSMLQGLTLSGTVSLPATTSSDLPVHINGWIDPYDSSTGTYSSSYDYYNGWYDVIVPAGQTSAAYSVTVPDTSYGLTLNYWLDEATAPANFYEYGQYSTSGTTPFYEDATQIYMGGSSQTGINLTVLSANTVTGTLAKPAGYTSSDFGAYINANTTDHKGIGGTWYDLNNTDQVQYSFKVPTLMTDYKLGYELYSYSDGTTQSVLPIIRHGYYTAAGTTPYESQATLLNNSGNNTGINLQMLEGVVKSGTFTIDQATLDQYYGVSFFAETDTDRISDYSGYYYDSALQTMYFSLVLPSDLVNFRVGVETYNMDSSTQGYLAADGSTVPSRDSAKLYATVNDLGEIALGVISSTGYSGTITLPAALSSSLNVEVYAEAENDGYGSSYTFAPGETSKSFTLNIPDGLSGLNLAYRIQDAVTGLVNRGYYTGSSTSAYRDEAASYTTSSLPAGATLDILKGTSFSGTVSFPSGYTAADNDELDILAVPKAAGGDVFRHTITVWVDFSARDTSGNYILTVPENDISSAYYLGYDFFDSNDFVRQGYYSATGTTGFLKNATLLDTAAGHQSGIDLQLLTGVGISGTVTSNLTLTDNTYLFVRASRDDGEEFFGGSDMSSGVTSYPYTVRVPSDTAHNYKLGYYVFTGNGDPVLLDSAVIGYWTSAGTVKNKTLAENVAVSTAAVTGKDMTVIAETAQSVSVNSGWNLLSLPSKAQLSTLDMILHFGFRQDDIDYLAKYGAAGWSYYFVNGFEETANRFNSLDSGEGFWLKANRSFTMTYALSDDAAYATEVKPLSAGWNLVGVNSDMTPGTLAALYDAYNIESMWVYKSGTWSIYIPNATIDTLVDPAIPRFTTISKFDGVWIRVKGGTQ